MRISNQFCPSTTFSAGVPLLKDSNRSPIIREIKHFTLPGKFSFGSIAVPTITSRSPVWKSQLNWELRGKSRHFCSFRRSGAVSDVDEAAFSDSDESTDDDTDANVDTKKKISKNSGIDDESLELLEWHSIRQQVQRFSNTVLTNVSFLTLGDSVSASQCLLDQTESAISLQSTRLDFGCVKDVTFVLRKSPNRHSCTIEEICIVGILLRAAKSLSEQLVAAEASPDFLSRPLCQIFEGSDYCSELLSEIDRCIHCSMNRIYSHASDVLEAIRREQALNENDLLAILKGTSQRLLNMRAMDGPLLVQRRNRYCLGVKSGFKSTLPGGVALDASNSGATLYIEPAEVIPLNNKAAQLNSQEAEEVQRILTHLTALIFSKVSEILDLQERIAILDQAVARASHARWLNAVKPHFWTHQHPTGRGSKVHMQGASHPLLLGPFLESNSRGPAQKPPVCIDFVVGESVTVVAITGPNTGGKTAAMKTLGAAALMAKAGLYVCADSAVLPWFDHVLADIGDEQSLEQSLSTFSGHIRRLVRILATAGRQSLVLLDEVGSGTDPSEGASLASAVLRQLAGEALLTVATTHYAELSSLKSADSRFENASVEFDVQTLRPTFRLLWGQSGQSNAFAIAQARQFDPRVIRRAEELAGQMQPADADARAGHLVGSLVSQTGALLQLAQSSLREREGLEAELEQMREALGRGDVSCREASLKELAVQAMTAEVVSVKKQLAEVVAAAEFQLGRPSPALPATEVYDSAAKAIRKVAKPYSSPLSEGLEDLPAEAGAGGSRPWQPRVGERVVVRRLGRQALEVVEEVRAGAEFAVQMGRIRVNVKVGEMLPHGPL